MIIKRKRKNFVPAESESLNTFEDYSNEFKRISDYCKKYVHEKGCRDWERCPEECGCNSG